MDEMSYGDEPYDGPECPACGGPAEFVEKFEPSVNNHGQVVGYWVLECQDDTCGHVERVAAQEVAV
jgi:hypothetical protein